MKSAQLVLLCAFFAASAMAQAPAPSENTGGQVSIAGGTVINAELDSSIDAKKAKSGDAVTAHITETLKASDNRAILPKGTKLMGHVTQASSRASGGTETMVAMQFDKATLKDGQEIPLATFWIQALAAPASAASFGGETGAMATPGPPSNSAPSNNPSMSGSRGARPDATTAPSYPNAQPGPSSGQPNASGPLPENARGVYGLEGVTLTKPSGSEGSVIASNGKNLRLDKGTRLLLVGQPQSGAAASSR